jgi:hypothetical protein
VEDPAIVAIPKHGSMTKQIYNIGSCRESYLQKFFPGVVLVEETMFMHHITWLGLTTSNIMVTLGSGSPETERYEARSNDSGVCRRTAGANDEVIF